MRKVFLILVLFSLFFPILSALAQYTNPLTTESFEELLNGIIEFLKAILIPFAALMFVIAGYLFITAIGNPQQIGMAKKTILFAMVGILFILLAEALIEMVRGWIS